MLEPVELLKRLFRWSELMAPAFAHGGVRVRPGSRLALTSELASPALVETFLSSDLLTVIEHVDALRLTLDGPTAHPRVPFTLLRAGIESTAMSLWLLLPTSRTDRAQRSVLRATASFRQEAHLRNVGDLQAPPTSQRDDAMREALQRVGLPTEGRALTTALKRTRVSDVFDDLSGVNLGVQRTVLWKLASGLAHGELYATIALSKPVAPSAADGTRLSNVAPDPDLIRQAAGCIGLDASRVLAIAREHGAQFHDETAVDEAIDLFANIELRERDERRAKRRQGPRLRK